MQNRILAGIVFLAFSARALLIWLTRPEYVGWFNHSYYYWVQTRGLLTDGVLPYTDLPLIFYGYAAIAATLQTLGMGIEPAIINAARFSMSLVPALVAVPVFYTLRRINTGQKLNVSMWLLVGMAAFLPLSMAHMPELLQKNMLGILLLVTLNCIVYIALQSRLVKHYALAVLLLLIIALTHLGTLAVSLVFAIALAAAFIHENDSRRKPLKIALTVIALIAACAATVAYLDPDAYSRVMRYAQSGVANSLLGRLLSGAPVAESALLLSGILVPVVLAFLLLRIYARHRDELALPDRVFWLSHILLAILLLAPIIDLDVVPRLLLFLPLPALVIVAFHLRCHVRLWANRLTLAAAVIGTALMLVGDVTGVLLQYPNKAETRAELDDMKQRFDLGSQDFVVTPYGGNTLCNWFLGTRSGLITAFNRNDLQDYARVFVLNPRDSQALGDAANRMQDGIILFETERQKYQAMRLNVPVAGNLPNMINYEQLRLFKMEQPPDDWIFDESGNWIGANYEAYLEE